MRAIVASLLGHGWEAADDGMAVVAPAAKKRAKEPQTLAECDGGDVVELANGEIEHVGGVYLEIAWCRRRVNDRLSEIHPLEVTTRVVRLLERR